MKALYCYYGCCYEKNGCGFLFCGNGKELVVNYLFDFGMNDCAPGLRSFFFPRVSTGLVAVVFVVGTVYLAGSILLFCVVRESKNPVFPYGGLLKNWLNMLLVAGVNSLESNLSFC